MTQYKFAMNKEYMYRVTSFIQVNGDVDEKKNMHQRPSKGPNTVNPLSSH